MNRKYFNSAIYVAVVFILLGMISLSAVSSKKSVTSANAVAVPSEVKPLKSSTGTIIHYTYLFDFYADTHQEEKSRLRQFHFQRGGKPRRFRNLWRILVQMIVVISHVSVLMYAFKAILI